MLSLKLGVFFFCGVDMVPNAILLSLSASAERIGATA